MFIQREWFSFVVKSNQKWHLIKDFLLTCFLYRTIFPTSNNFLTAFQVVVAKWTNVWSSWKDRVKRQFCFLWLAVGCHFRRQHVIENHHQQLFEVPCFLHSGCLFEPFICWIGFLFCVRWRQCFFNCICDIRFTHFQVFINFTFNAILNFLGMIVRYVRNKKSFYYQWIIINLTSLPSC